MDENVKAFHEEAIVVDGHNHIMLELYKRRLRGDKAVFSNYYAPRIRQGGVNVIMLVVGGDHIIQNNDSDLMLWGALWNMDMLWEEVEESKEDIALCLNCNDIDRALSEGKIAILITMHGGRPLEGKPNMETLVGLHTFYKLGLRQLMLVDNGRNRIADGKGEERTGGGLTNFGVSVVKEMNRLGILIDVAHIADRGFWDVIEISQDPVVDTHTMARGVCDHNRNLTDEQIKAIAQKGGVIGMSCFSATITTKEWATVEDLIDHVDYIADLVGIEHIGLGPDHTHFELVINMWNPPHKPGWMEGVNYGVKETYMIEELKDITTFPIITEALMKRGYSPRDVKKVLGENWLRVYRQILG